MSSITAGWWDTRAGGECWARWEAPVSALEQDLSSKAPKEVVNKDRAPEEGLRVVYESHLLQGKAQHMGTLLQNWCHLKDIILLDSCKLLFFFFRMILCKSVDFSIFFC